MVIVLRDSHEIHEIKTRNTRNKSHEIEDVSTKLSLPDVWFFKDREELRLGLGKEPGRYRSRF